MNYPNLTIHLPLVGQQACPVQSPSIVRSSAIGSGNSVLSLVIPDLWRIVSLWSEASRNCRNVSSPGIRAARRLYVACCFGAGTFVALRPAFRLVQIISISDVTV